MNRRFGGAVALTLAFVLASCSLPRGAGIQSEVLAVDQASVDAGVPAGFVVYPVTRETLPIAASWPATGSGGLNWIRREKHPTSLAVAPGDTIAVTVWDAEENSLLSGPGQRVSQLQNVQVSSNGTVFLPFVGDLQIGGLTPDMAREKIEERYVGLISSAQVQVAVTPGRANTANLVSGVAAPGVFPLVDRDVTLLGLIAMGGGVKSGLENPQVRLFRGGSKYGVSVSRLFEDPALDTTMQGGDRVIIESDDRYFLSLGAAGTEARHIFPQDRITALDAMSIVGGVSDERGNPKGILILREYPQSAVRSDSSGPTEPRVVFTIDLTTADGLFSAGRFTVMPKDLVYVTESPVNSARTLIGLLAALGLTSL